MNIRMYPLPKHYDFIGTGAYGYWAHGIPLNEIQLPGMYKHTPYNTAVNNNRVNKASQSQTSLNIEFGI